METILSKRLKELREENRKSQNEVRIDLKINQTTFSNYENGTRVPPLNVLIKLARYYNVSVDYLIGNSEFKNSQHEQSHQQLNLLSLEAVGGLSTHYSNRAIEVLDVLLQDIKFALLLEAFYSYYKGIVNGETILYKGIGYIDGIYFGGDSDALKRQYMHFVIGHMSEYILKYLDEVREKRESE